MANIEYYQEKTHRKRVYYTGSDVLKNGHALCYDRDNITAVSRSDGSTAIAAANASYARAIYVEKPASGNLSNFAGIVAESSETTEAGPRWIDIIEPTGGLIEVFTEENCTMGTTMLSVKPDSYVFGGASEGLPVALAHQTVDRSTTNGLVQAELYGAPSPSATGFGPALPSSSINAFSRTIWDTMPAVPAVTLYFEDFNGQTALSNAADATAVDTGTTTTETPLWIQTEVTSGLTSVTEASGGILNVSSEASASADDGLTVMWRQTPWVPTASKRIWAEWRVKYTGITTSGSEDQYYTGLSNTITSALPSGVVDDTVDKIGFFRHDGSTSLRLSFITSKTSAELITADAATIAEDTWINLGFVADLTSITPYVNGVAGTAHTTTANLPSLGMGICLAAVSESATTALQSVDWIRIAQTR